MARRRKLPSGPGKESQSNNETKSKTKTNSSSESEEISNDIEKVNPSPNSPNSKTGSSSPLLIVLGAMCCFLLNVVHTSTLFENDRHFSHLSTLEREMTFRTEMGFYYWHYKVLVEAPTYVEGLNRLIHNNISEYPDVINSLQRFNIMPEIMIAAGYRSLSSFANWLDIGLTECWQVSRSPPMPPVMSCVGLGEPANFYVACCWGMAGATAGLIFLSGALLSRSFLGGVISAACFFFNHGESTRVMWAPPLRETFAFPFCLIVNLLITWVVRRPRKHYSQPVQLAAVVFFYLTCWQLSQYYLMISLLAVYLLYTLEFIRPISFLIVLTGVLFGFINSIIYMFFNKMLMTSYLAASIAALFMLYLFLENVFNYVPSPLNKSLQMSFMILSTFYMKLEITNFLGETEDSHVYNLLLAKFTNYSDFHTLLYTCADEFDFLPPETVIQLMKSGLIPVVLGIITTFILNTLRKIFTNIRESSSSKSDASSPHILKGVDAGIVYNIIILIAYCIFAFMIMRLKLFMTPQLCIVASLLTSQEVFRFKNYNYKHIMLVVAALALMSLSGSSNLKRQRDIRGEYSNPNFEKLLEWVNVNTPPNAVFGGAMPTMANVMLSTKRPIVNHPHYETAEIRRRTKLIYSVFGRGTPQTAYETLLGLKMNYLVLDYNWCYGKGKPGCGMIDLWDREEDTHSKKKAPLCPQLFSKNPTPFVRVFKNEDYAVLQVPSQFVQIPPPKSFKS